jgi:hypothetical protein
LAISIIIFDPGILELTDLVELFKGNQFLLEIVCIKLLEAIISKDPISLEPSL